MRKEVASEERVNESPDRGSGTLLMLAVVIFSCFLVLLTAVLATAIVARHRAEAAADLAALAAASRPPAADGCAQASRVALANAGHLRQCRWLPDGSVLVGVEIPSRGSHLSPAVTSVARAGPGPVAYTSDERGRNQAER